MNSASASFYAKNLWNTLTKPMPFIVQAGNSQFVIRPRTWDLAIIDEVTMAECYLPTLISPNTKMKTIVDLGGNIGDFTVWAQDKFHPNLMVVAEPDLENLKILEQNVKLNGLTSTTKVFKKAVFTKNGTIGFDTETINKGRNAVNPDATANLVETITLKDFLAKSSVELIDYMKIDIEGGERFVLTPENEKIFTTKVKYVFMETHTRLGAHKEDPEKYFKKLGFKTKYSEAWSNFGAGALEAVNPKFHK